MAVTYSKEGLIGFWYGTAAERATETRMTTGDKFTETDTLKKYEYTGSAWILDEQEVNLNTSDIQIGAVEIKNATSDARAVVSATGSVNVVLTSGSDTVGKVGIDQVTAGANEVVTKTGSLVSLEAGTEVIGNVGLEAGSEVIGKVGIDQVTANANEVVTKTGSTVGIDQTTDGTTNLVRTKGATVSAYSSWVFATSGVIKSSPGTLYGIYGYNDSGSDQYIQIHDADTVPIDTSVPTLIVAVPTKSSFSVDFGTCGLPCATGIVWCNSSTAATKTIGAADCFVSAIYL